MKMVTRVLSLALILGSSLTGAVPGLSPLAGDAAGGPRLCQQI